MQKTGPGGASFLLNLPALSSALVVVASAIQFGIVRDRFILEVASLFCVVTCIGFVVSAERHKLPALFIWPFILLFLFGVGAVISGMCQGSAMLAIGAIFFMLTTYVVVINSYFSGEKAIHMVAGVSLVVCVVVMSASFFQGFSIYRFEGVFDNPNGMGRYTSVLILFFFLYGVFYARNLSALIRVFIYGLCIVLLIGLLASNSRGSLAALLGAFFLVGLVYVFRFFSDVIVGLRIRKSFVKGLISLIFILFGVVAVVVYSGVHESLVQKFVAVSSAGDFSQGRFGLWRDGIKNLNFCGYADYKHTLNLEYDAHNNFVHILLNYGFFAPLFFILYFLVLGWHFFVGAVMGGRPVFVMGFAFFVYLMLYWMVETGSAIFPAWILAVLYGYSVSPKRLVSNL